MESVILSSKPTSQFPNNHGGDFRNAINHPLNVQYKPGQQFKVALAELFYVPGSWSNVRTGANYVDIHIKNYPVIEIVLQTVHVDLWGVLSDKFQKFGTNIALNLPWERMPRAREKGSGEKFLRLIRYLPNEPPGRYRMYKIYDSARNVNAS